MNSNAVVSRIGIFLILVTILLLGMPLYAEDGDNNPPGMAGGPGAGADRGMREKARVNEEWEKLADTNRDGFVDRFEWKQWQEKSGSNPPGPVGGPGTNFEDSSAATEQSAVNTEQYPPLPPKRVDVDNNPPGPIGGAGTNWENPAGPVGGPGAGPDGRPLPPGMGNPPGPRGGPGVGNPPGPVGGPGRSNPPGPRGGPGAGNPPGPRGGPGAGAAPRSGGPGPRK